MDVIRKHSIFKAKFYLVFFWLVTLISCGLGDAVNIERVEYENNRAVGVKFTTQMDVEKIRVFVGEESETSVIGVIVGSDDTYNFAPVVPFTAGQTYTIRKGNTEVLTKFAIPHRAKTKANELLAIYPKVDTVPENLLKMYFEFTQPMQEVGNALDYISVTDEIDGKATQPFLKLESELWNKDRTLLTLWLDPGRIKTDLIPNRERGLPLTKGNIYTVVVDSSWKSSEGVPLKKTVSKRFYVGVRDDEQPNIDRWDLKIHKADSVNTLYLDFKEYMDAFLAKETIGIYDTSGKRINGQYILNNDASALTFIPSTDWQTPNIEIRIEARLEDLAGNNLNRLFDTALKKAPNQKTPKNYYSIPFEVR